MVDIFTFFSALSSAATLASYAWPGIRGTRKVFAPLALACIVIAAMNTWRTPTAQAIAPLTVVQAAQTEPSYRAIFELGFSEAGQGNCAAALGLYSLLPDGTAAYPTIHLQKAFCLRQLGRIPEARREAEKAVTASQAAGGFEGLTPLGTVEFTLASISFLAGDPAASKSALEKALNHGFPYDCQVDDDDDLRSMGSWPELSPLVSKIIAKGSVHCG